MRLISFGLVLVLATSAIGGSASGAERDARAKPLADKSGPEKRASDATIRQILIKESIAAYDGNCPCPYSRARNGFRCGKRSAWSREGGAAPLCFPTDVSTEMVQAYRDQHPDP
jgi:hypothetical protein